MQEQLFITGMQQFSGIGQDTLQVQKKHITVDLQRMAVTGPKGTYRLTKMECRLLRIFMLVPRQVILRMWLMKAVWELDWNDAIQSLDVHINSLRQKIEEDPDNPHYLKTVPGLGYCFVPD